MQTGSDLESASIVLVHVCLDSANVHEYAVPFIDYRLPSSGLGSYGHVAGILVWSATVLLISGLGSYGYVAGISVWSATVLLIPAAWW